MVQSSKQNSMSYTLHNPQTCLKEDLKLVNEEFVFFDFLLWKQKEKYTCIAKVIEAYINRDPTLNHVSGLLKIDEFIPSERLIRHYDAQKKAVIENMNVKINL